MFFFKLFSLSCRFCKSPSENPFRVTKLRINIDRKNSVVKKIFFGRHWSSTTPSCRCRLAVRNSLQVAGFGAFALSSLFSKGYHRLSSSINCHPCISLWWLIIIMIQNCLFCKVEKYWDYILCMTCLPAYGNRRVSGIQNISLHSWKRVVLGEFCWILWFS